MSIQYAGGTIVNYTFTDAGTRADLVSKLNAQLKLAGWSVISGDGTADVLMKSAVTAQGLSIRFRLYDPGAGNCAQFTMKNNAGTLTSQINYLYPASVQWRIIANKYQFFMFRTGASSRSLARSVLLAGTIWVPEAIATLMAGDPDCGWVQCTGDADAGTTARGTFRTWLSLDQDVTNPASSGRSSTLYMSNMINYVENLNQGGPMIMVPIGCWNTYRTMYRWMTNSLHQLEPAIGWSSTALTTGEHKWIGQLWDSFVACGAYDGETTISYNGHTFMRITDQPSGYPYGTLYVAVD